MKRSFLVILAIIALIIITGCSFEKEEEKTIVDKFKSEYESLNGKVIDGTDLVHRKITIPEDHPFVYKTANDIITMMDNGETFVVYFGFAKCPWCRSVLPTLIDVAKDLELKEIYYVDVSDIRDTYKLEGEEVVLTKEGSEGYIGLLKRFEDVLDDYTLTDENGEEVEVGEKRIYAPNVVSVVSGQAKQLETGISDEQDDPFMDLSKDIKADMYNKFKCSLKCVMESKNVCTSKTVC